MKIRKGFVSNSSSSSYICDICGDAFEMWDESPTSCEYGHYFCYDCIPDNCEGEGSVEEKDCPYCSFEKISEYDFNNYILAKYNLNKGDIENEIYERFENFSEFIIYINENKNRKCD